MKVTWKQVLSRGRKALLIRGGAHLTRSPKSQTPKKDRRNVIEILIEDHGVDPMTIGMWGDSDGNLPDVERGLAKWPVPSIATIGGTRMGVLPATDFFSFRIRDADGNWGPPFVGVAIGELFDAYLYVGATEQMRYPDDDSELFTPEYRAELDRRRGVFGIPEVFSAGVEEDGGDGG